MDKKPFDLPQTAIHGRKLDKRTIDRLEPIIVERRDIPGEPKAAIHEKLCAASEKIRERFKQISLVTVHDRASMFSICVSLMDGYGAGLPLAGLRRQRAGS